MAHTPDTKLLAELDVLRQRVAELEQGEAAHRDSAEQRQAADLRNFYSLIENAPDAIIVTDMQGIVTYVNPAFKVLYGYGDASIGMQIVQFFSPSEHESLDAILKQVLAQGSWQGTMTNRRQDGSLFVGQESSMCIYDSNGVPQALGAIVRDITDVIQAEQERSALQEQVIAAQQAALMELSTPLIPINEHVVVMPIVGAVDSRRVQQVIETLLEGVSTTGAQIAILDITGVPIVDTQVANGLIRAAQAVKLLGAQVILTGIRPEVAQTLVGLGVNLADVATVGSLQDGIALAVGRR